MSVAGPAHDASRIEDDLCRAARDAPAHTAVVDGDLRLDYAALAARVEELAAVLAAADVQPGDRVAIHLDKSVGAVCALYAIWRAGGIAVQAGDVLRARQVAHLVDHSGACLLLTRRRLRARLGELPQQGVDVLLLDEGLPAGGTVPPRAALRGGDEPASILYTSGSTGLPKGIVISHDNLVAGARIVARYLELQPDERILSVVPFSFDYGLNQLLTAVRLRAALVLQRSARPADVCRALQRHAITGLAGVPPFWIQLVDGPSPFAEGGFPALRYLTNTGGAFPVPLVRRTRAAVPHARLYLMYGLSEAFRSTYLPPAEVDARPDSIGIAVPETEILVLDAQGRACAPGEPGELVHRGPTVAHGYWNDPEATSAVFRPDPDEPAARPVVHSGDLVRRDEDGFLYFVGRRDAMIKSLGYRVSPEEVEALALDSGLLREAVARGVPDEQWGQAIVLHVVARDSERFDPDALHDFFRREAPRHLQPARVVAHASLPRTATGKVDRGALD